MTHEKRFGFCVAAMAAMGGSIAIAFFQDFRTFDGGLGIVLALWVFFLLPAIVLSSPIWWFGRRRARWLWWESNVLVFPYLIWILLSLANLVPKSLGNFAEASLVGCRVPIAALIRVMVGQRYRRQITALAVSIALCVAAALIYWLMPVLPE